MKRHVLICAALLGCSGGTGTPGATDAAVEDAGDASTNDASAGDGGACPTYDKASKACTVASDCATVARGCYCGQQPVIGVAQSIAARASACEQEVANTCALGCPNAPGRVAEDGKDDQDGGTIAVDCKAGACTTRVR